MIEKVISRKVVLRELPECPERAAEEAIANVIHRDYANCGGEVHIDICGERLEVVSPGTPNSRRTIDKGLIRILPALHKERVSAELNVIPEFENRTDLCMRFLQGARFC